MEGIASNSKAVSPFIEMVFTILFGVMMLAIIVNTVNPLFDRATDTSAVNDAFQNLELLRSAVESVASEAQGSTRTVPLSVSGGTYRVNATYDWLYFEYDPQEALQLFGQRGNVLVRQGLQFADWFDSYATGSASSAGWTNTSGIWSFSDYKYVGTNGTAYHNVSGPLTNWRFSASIANVSGSTGGEVFALPGNPESLVGYWTADEASGNTFYDWSGRGNTGYFSGNNNGTLTNMNTTGNATSGWQSGGDCKYGGCLKFDEVNDRVITNNMSFSGEFTVSFWAKRTDDSYNFVLGSSTAGMVQKIGFSSGSNSIFVRVIAGGSSDTSVVLQQNTWHHMAITRNSSNIVDAYFNGTKYTLFSGAPQVGLYSFDWIGGNGDSQYFNGTIDDVTVWSRSLSADEVASEYSGARAGETLGASTNTTGLVGWWKLNEGSGSSAADDSMRAYGRYVGGMMFDGAADYIDTGTNTITGSSPFTLSAWVKTNTVSKYSGAVSIGSASGGQSAYIGTVATAQTGTTNSIGGGFYGDNYGSGVTTLGEWVHVSMTYDGLNVIVYVNGYQKVTDTYTSNLQATSRRIGKISTSTLYDFNGTIDEVMIFNRSISADEVAALYETSYKKISGAGGSQSIAAKTPNPAIVLANPAGATRFDNIEVVDGTSTLTFIIPFSDADINGTLRTGKGDHSIEVRNMGAGANGRPVVQLAAS